MLQSELKATLPIVMRQVKNQGVFHQGLLYFCSIDIH